MSELQRTRRQQLLREAEGYLELIMIFADQWPPHPVSRDRLARRALDTLDRIGDPGVDLGHVLYLKGQAQRTLEEYELALRPLQEASAEEPCNIHIWLALGWCYKRLDRIDMAIESLEEALAADPTQAITHYNLACYWSLAENVDQALFHLSQAFEIDTNFRDLVAKETDFDPIRDDAGFQMLTSVIV